MLACTHNSRSAVLPVRPFSALGSHMWLKTDMSVPCLYVIFVWLALRSCQYLDCTASNGRMSSDWWTGKDLEGSDRWLIENYPGICVKGLRNTKECSILDSWCPAQIKTEHVPNTILERLSLYAAARPCWTGHASYGIFHLNLIFVYWTAENQQRDLAT
jgi:hypothetical protein